MMVPAVLADWMKPTSLPSSQDTQLLRAALLERDPALAAFAAWRHGLDFDTVGIGSQRVLAQLYRNVSTFATDDQLMGRLKGIARHTWVSNNHHIAAARPIFTTFGTSNIPVILLKGLALTATLPEQMALRPIDEIEILVPAERQTTAMEALADLGWRQIGGPMNQADRRLDESRRHYQSEPGFRLSLNGSMLDFCRWPDADAALWSRATRVKDSGRRCLVPSIEDQVLHACVRSAQWSPPDALRWAADAVILLRTANSQFSWDCLISETRRRHVVVPLRHGLEFLHRELGIHVPAAVRHELRRTWVSFAGVVESALRGSSPYGHTERQESFLAFQDFRRTQERYAERKPLSSLCAWLRHHWAVDSCLTAAAMSLFAATRRPPWLRAAALRFWPRDTRRAVVNNRHLPAVSEGTIDLSLARNGPSGILYGWSQPEADGRWTLGREAAIAFRIDGQTGPLQVELVLLGLATPAAPALRIEIWANQFRLPDWTFAPGLQHHKVSIPASALSAQTLVLTFVIRDPRSPQALGLSSDRRPLGVFVRRIVFSALDRPCAAGLPSSEIE